MTAIASVHVIGSRSIGGAEKFYIRLVSALHEAGCPVTAVSPPDSGVGTTLYPAIPQAPVAMRNVFDPVARFRIGRIIRNSGAPIVQTYMGRATRLTHVKPDRGVVHIARLGGYYDVRGYRHAHAWVGNTRGICEYLVDEGLPADRVFQIGNFVDPAPETSREHIRELREELAVPADAHVLLGVGRLHPNKDFATLLRAFALVDSAPDGRPLHLIIVGDGPARQSLHRRADRLKLDDRVHWAGWHDHPHDFFQMADAFICPSRHEPLGNVILEAWANGAPVISTRTRGATELIEPGRNGLLVPCEDPEALAAAIREFFAMPDEDKEGLVAAGRQTLEERHSKKAVVARYIELYQDLAG